MATTQHTIFFIEDSDIDFEMAVLATRRVRPKAKVLRSITSCDAEKKLAVESLSLVVVDIHLPDGNGIDFLRKLRNLDAGKSVSVVVFSTSSSIREREDALIAGATEYVQKPSNPEDYLAAVSRFVDRWALSCST